MRLALMLLAAAVFCGAVVVKQEEKKESNCQMTLALTEEGRQVPGLVRVVNEQGEEVPLPGLISRGLGLPGDKDINRWWMLTKPTKLELPQGRYELQAFAGLETELAKQPLVLNQAEAEVSVPLSRFYQAAVEGWRSANTHLHLNKLTKEDADRYLSQAPRVDGLDMVFVSYLERVKADLEYTSNKYDLADLERIGRSSGVAFGYGEEHRHNFLGFGEGYGHVMLLNIKQLVQPVSIGPGIMGDGDDGRSIQQGIDEAKRDGASIIWCHNAWGLEDVPNWVTGRLDAQNIFDGGTHGSFKDSFYRYLNAGVKVPFSTGTDWFMYDFSRVYVPSRRPLTTDEWLKKLSAGQSYITNGPLLEFTLNGQSLGDTVDLPQAGEVEVVAQGLGRVDFERLELVQNGQVVWQEKTQAVGKHFRANIKRKVPISGPCWLALRTPPPPVKDDPELQAAVPLNEYGKSLFAHTSAIFVTVGGQSLEDRAAVQALVSDMERAKEFIEKQSKFTHPDQKPAVLKVYDQALEQLRQKLPPK